MVAEAAPRGDGSWREVRAYRAYWVVKETQVLTVPLAEAPFCLDGHDLAVSTSVGIALAGPDHADPAALLQDADVALYRAKERGKARWALFDPGMGARLRERVALEVDLRRALERGELALHYQPVVELASGRVATVEALLRWEHPARGSVTPAAFVPVAEETGLIVPLGRWVLTEACRQLRQWQLCAPGGHAPTMSVNVSSRQLLDPAVLDDVAAVLAETQLAPNCLTLEITESVIMQDTAVTLRKLHALKALGVRLAIDDFGTGYSSLSYLQRFPVDILKIDKAFVNGVSRANSDAALARTIIALASMLELRTVAEGVEHADQRTQLVALGCALGQGYLFAKPLTAADIELLLSTEGDRLLETITPAADARER